MSNYEKEKCYLAERRVFKWVMCFCTIIAMGLSILSIFGKERTKPTVITEEPVSYEEGTEIVCNDRSYVIYSYKKVKSDEEGVMIVNSKAQDLYFPGKSYTDISIRDEYIWVGDRLRLSLDEEGVMQVRIFK